MRRSRFAAALLLLCVSACASEPDAWESRLSEFIAEEMARKGIPAISITMADDTGWTWSQGFGGTVDGTTVYRVASVSKLFTAMAVMQLVEQGVLDLDEPVATYIPEFTPEDPFGIPITLRHLVSHQSGMVREPPVGNYFDDTEPGLDAMVASLNQTRLVLPPASGTKYSNAAVSVAGYIVQQVTGVRWEDYVQEALLDKIGMTSSSFAPRAELRARLGDGYMWRYDTDALTDAPIFELGIGPAANLYSTTDDLGRFAHTLFAVAHNERPDILTAASLQEMWSPQAPGSDTGFGLGFFAGRLDSLKMAGHAGVMYGYATWFMMLPERGLSVAVVSNVDATNPVIDRIARLALRLVMAHRDGSALPKIERTVPVDSALARDLDGRYRAGGRTVTLTERGGALLMRAGSERYELRMLGDQLISDGRLDVGNVRLKVREDTLTFGTLSFVRQEPVEPAPAPEHLMPYLGEYGPDHNILYIYEEDGHLHSLIEWFFHDRLEHVSDDEFRYPPYGLYSHEPLVFARDESGNVVEASLAGVSFRRRSPPVSSSTTFKITPLLPADSLRARVAPLTPPARAGTFRAPDLVAIDALDSTIRLDIRYATDNNFMDTPFYRVARALLQRPAAEAAVRAHRALAAHGYGLVVYDGYRPWHVTKMFWDATPDSLRHFVANPDNGSRHNRGCALDVGLYDLESGEVVAMPSGYDEFTARAYADYPGGTAISRYRRELLRDAMEEEGFAVYDSEWWHYDYRDWRAYPILDEPLEAVQ